RHHAQADALQRLHAVGIGLAKIDGFERGGIARGCGGLHKSGSISSFTRVPGTPVAEHFQLKLEESFMLAPSVRHLSFARADGAPFAFTPGQFIQVHFNYADGKPTKRSYSVGTVGDAPGAVQRLEIAVSYVQGGAATEL